MLGESRTEWDPKTGWPVVRRSRRGRFLFGGESNRLSEVLVDHLVDEGVDLGVVQGTAAGFQLGERVGRQALFEPPVELDEFVDEEHGQPGWHPAADDGACFGFRNGSQRQRANRQRVDQCGATAVLAGMDEIEIHDRYVAADTTDIAVALEAPAARGSPLRRHVRIPASNTALPWAPRRGRQRR